MGGKGNFYDNSMVQAFFKSIKVEMIWSNRWDTRSQAEGAIFQYIKGFYNPRRRHSSPGGKSPLAFELKAAQMSWRDQNVTVTRTVHLWTLPFPTYDQRQV